MRKPEILILIGPGSRLWLILSVAYVRAAAALHNRIWCKAPETATSAAHHIVPVEIVNREGPANPYAPPLTAPEFGPSQSRIPEPGYGKSFVVVALRLLIVVAVPYAVAGIAGDVFGVPDEIIFPPLYAAWIVLGLTGGAFLFRLVVRAPSWITAFRAHFLDLALQAVTLGILTGTYFLIDAIVD